MQMKLPHSEFSWLSEEEIESFDIEKFDVNGDYGVVLEVFKILFGAYQNLNKGKFVTETKFLT